MNEDRHSGRPRGRHVFVCSSVGFRTLPFLERATESLGLRCRFQDMGTIGDAIQQCLAETDIVEDLRPFRKWKIGGHDDRRAFGSIGDDLKQQFGPNVGQRDVTDLIDGDQSVARPSCQRTA